MRKRLIMAWLSVATLAVVLPCSICGVPGTMTPPVSVDHLQVKVGSHKLFCRLLGDRAQLVVVEPGITETFRTWESIVADLAKLTRVLVDDRAEYGESEPMPRPRTSRHVAVELARLLEQVGRSSPVVLVRHSLGGLYALAFASQYPDRVAGLVLQDPPPVDFILGRALTALRVKAEQFTQQFKESATTRRSRGDERQAAFFEAVASRHEALFEGASGKEFNDIKHLGDIPLTVISSEKPNRQSGDFAGAFQRLWIQSNERLTRLSGDNRYILETNASHHIHREALEVVIPAVRDLVERERRRSKFESDAPPKSNATRQPVSSDGPGGRHQWADPAATNQ